MLSIDDDSISWGHLYVCAHISIGKRVVISYNVTIADSDFHPLDAEERKQDAVANAPGGDRSRRPKVVSQP